MASISLTKIGKERPAAKFIATVEYNAVEDTQEPWDESPRTRWIQKLKMLDIDNRDDLGREVTRLSKNNVFGKSGQAAGQGSGVQVKADAYATLLGVDDIDDGSMILGKTFRFEARRVERGKNNETGEVIAERVDVPVEYFPTGYVHPSDKARPVWQFKPREDAAMSAADTVVNTAAVYTQDDIDEVLAKMYDGQSEAPNLSTLVNNSATKSKAVIDDVKSGAALKRLMDKGIIVENDGQYVKLG